ncbi:MAG TPA: CBS domain-containing protein [Gaiellaceae bacterium]|nr:CBS domain-containing protein [Gaiellaceae bacterium]
MTPSPTTVKADQPATEAAKLMREADAGMIPVVDDGDIFGTVTDRDIVVRVVAAGKDPQSTPVREIASTDPITVEPDQDLNDALELMARHQVRRLPVVEEGRLIGVVAQADLAREADERKVGEAVEQISK